MRSLPFLFAVTLVIPVAVTCGGSNADKACAPGQSIACVGNGGCAGNQVCKSDSSGYEPCMCGTASDGGGDGASGMDGSNPDGNNPDGNMMGDAGPWTPKSLAGLSMWLDDDTGVVMDPQNTGALLRWLDQSGNGNKAETVNTQQNFRFDVDPKVLNGHDAYRCPGNGTWLTVADSQTLRWGTSDFVIGMVIKISTQVTPELYVKDSQQGNWLYLAFTQGSVLNLQAGTSKVTTVPQSINGFHIVIVRGQTLRIRLDGQDTTGPAAGVNVDNTGASVVLCRGGSFTDVELAEVIAAKGTVTDGEVSSMEAYFKKKFAL